MFLTHARESLDLHYERTLYDVAPTPNDIGGKQLADPRTTHGFVLEVDAFGNETKSAAVGYGRRHQDPDPLMRPTDRAVQDVTLITYTESRYTNSILDDDAYRTPMPADVRTCELTGYQPSGTAGRFQGSDFVAPVNGTLSLIFDSEIPYEAEPSTGRQRRPIEHVRTLYRSDDLNGALPLLELDSLALPYASYKLALTPGLLSTVYLRPQPEQPPPSSSCPTPPAS